MTKKVYYSIITAAFWLISMPTIFSLIFNDPFLVNLIPVKLIKSLLILFIYILEVKFIKKYTLKVIGCLLPIPLFIGVLFKIMSLQFANEFFISGMGLMIINLIVASILERNKEVIHYLLYLFIFQRLLIIIIGQSEPLWWIDFILCLMITIIGIMRVFNIQLFKNKLYER